MLGISIGLLMGVATCEVVGRHLSGYSIVMEILDWFRSLDF